MPDSSSSNRPARAGADAFRFQVGARVVCNLGPVGWKLGRVVALRYREPGWPDGREAPYQVLLDDDNALIYVPEDIPSLCREARDEDVRMARRPDALAELEGDEPAVPNRHWTAGICGGVFRTCL